MADKKFFDTNVGKAANLSLTIGSGGLFALGKSVAKKYKEANTGIKQQVSALERQEVAPEITQANQEAQMMKNQGLGSAALGLYQQEAQRGQASALSALGGRRSALAGIGSIVQAGEDSALRLAGMDEQARQQNMMNARSSAIGLGQEKMALDKYKQEGLFNYYMGKKQALNRTMAGIATGAARIGAAALTGGASEAAGIGGAISKVGQGAGGASAGANFGLSGLPSSSSVPKYDFNQGSASIFKSPSLGYKPMGLKKNG